MSRPKFYKDCMGRFWISFTHIVILMFLEFAWTSATGHAGVLSLREAREEALRANLNLNIAREKVAEAQSTKNDRYTKLFPLFSTQGDATHTGQKPRVKLKTGDFGTLPFIGPIPSQDISAIVGKRDTFSATLQLEQPVFEGGRVYFSYLSSKSHEDVTLWDEKQVVQDVLVAVEQAYLNLLKTEEIKGLSLQHLDNIKAHLKDMELKYKEGRVALNDLLKVKVEVERANEDVIKAENDLQIAKGELNLVLNHSFDQPVEVTPVEDPTPVSINVHEAEELARLNRPAIKSAYESREEALLRTRVAEADYYPGFKFMAQYNRQTEEPNTPAEDWTVMMIMDYTLWEWGGTSQRVHAARSVERQRGYNAKLIEKRIIADVWEAWLQIQKADKSIEVAKQALIQADENLRIVRFGFAHGAKTSSDVLDAEELHAKTSLEHVSAKYDAYLARVLFRYAIGQMSVENNQP